MNIVRKIRQDNTNDPHLLGKGDIKKLLVQYSLPAILGMVITSLYHIVDSIFIGHGIGALALFGACRNFSYNEHSRCLFNPHRSGWSHAYLNSTRREG